MTERFLQDSMRKHYRHPCPGLGVHDSGPARPVGSSAHNADGSQKRYSLGLPSQRRLRNFIAASDGGVSSGSGKPRHRERVRGLAELARWIVSPLNFANRRSIKRGPARTRRPRDRQLPTGFQSAPRPRGGIFEKIMAGQVIEKQKRATPLLANTRP